MWKTQKTGENLISWYKEQRWKKNFAGGKIIEAFRSCSISFAIFLKVYKLLCFEAFIGFRSSECFFEVLRAFLKFWKLFLKLWKLFWNINSFFEILKAFSEALSAFLKTCRLFEAFKAFLKFLKFFEALKSFLKLWVLFWKAYR